MNLWHDLEAGLAVPRKINVVVEIPKGSRNQYKFDPLSGAFRLDRVLHAAIEYPADYGMIPRTYRVDGEPLRVLVMTDEPAFVSCIRQARPVGLFRLIDRAVQNDIILVVPLKEPLFRDYYDLHDLPKHFLQEVAHFFSACSDLEGTPAKTIGWENAAQAQARIEYAVALYQKTFRKPKK